ncbi:MAG TPA: DUF4136 domain-containing protein [Anaeromyxobacter sp.]|jgi:hypothetical protein|nr:DUF4136 domain-containing protein [Anaeromyxobacter sp.]
MNSRLAALAAAAFLASCVESAPDSVLHGVAVVTQNSSTANFASFSTFSIDPMVAVVDQTGSVTNMFQVDGSQLVPTIRTNMEQRGYTFVPWVGNTTPADLQIKMEAHLGSADLYYPGYCGWYPYYYCYPGWTYAGSYNFGTFVVTMGDASGRPQGSQIPLVWTAINYGILSSYYTSGGPPSGTNVNYGRVQEAINRAFAQSPYIQR